jgi:hypothetical protein
VKLTDAQRGILNALSRGPATFYSRLGWSMYAHPGTVAKLVRLGLVTAKAGTDSTSLPGRDLRVWSMALTGAGRAVAA